MKQSTFSAQVANNLLTVLQGYSKTIRLLLVMFLTLTASTAWGQTTTTYTFSSKSWAASPANWTSGKEGNQMQSGRGIQVTTGASGANATSPKSFTNVSKIVVTYSTNASAGAGTIKIKIGSNTEVSQDVTKTGGTTDRTLTYNFSPNQTGSVKVTVTCSTNSIYLKSIAITEAAATVNHTVTWNVNGEVYETTEVTEGSKPTFPANPSSCDATSNTFYGWATATWDGKINDVSAKTIYTSANDMPAVNGAVTYYAVFAEATTTGGGGESTDVTIDLTSDAQVTTNSAENLVFTEGDVTFTNTKVSGQTNANNYCPSTRTSTRTYNGHKVTIAAGSTISKIVITAASTNYATAIQNATWTNGSATTSSSTVTVTPSSGVSTVSFAPSATAGMTKVVVTTGGGGTTTYDNYITTCAGSTPDPIGYTITYNTNGGDAIASVVAMALPDPLPTAKRTHYTFEGWYTDTEFTTAAVAGATLNADITLYAKWSPKVYLTTLHPNEGVLLDTSGVQQDSIIIEYVHGTSDVDIPVANYYQSITREGYKFKGWYNDKDGGSKRINVSKVNNQNFWAQWLEERTVTYYSIGQVYDTQTYGNGETLTLPTTDPTACDGYTFVGWTTAEQSETTTKPTLVSNTTVVSSNMILYAVYAVTEAGGGEEWVEAAVGSIEEKGEVVITMTTSGGTTYALSNSQGTGSAPSADIVTVSNSKLSSAPADTLKWNITNSSGNLTIYPNGTTATWLYCNSSNNGVRVGTNANKIFTIDASSGYLKHTATSRYLGVYTTTPDWRCYTNTTGNTANQTLKFYKKSGGSTTIYTTSPNCCPVNLEKPQVTYSVADGAVTLNWTMVNNESDVADYTVACVGGEIHTTTATSYTFTGLTNCAEYTFTVKANGDGTDVCSSGVTAVTATPAAGSFTVTFDYGAGEGTPTQWTSGCANGTSTTLPTPTTLPENHTFEGWYDGTNLYVAGDNYTPTSDVTLYARYTRNTAVDIVEWDPNSVTVEIGVEGSAQVQIENEVEHGLGVGSAEGLFFSKYFEGSGSLKMIAIYNGTGKDVDLTDYFIYKGHNGSAEFDADDVNKISYPLSELGVIKQGQEIVLYSWPLNTDDEASVYSCSQTFLHNIANESGQDANPRWILCGEDPTNSITPIYSDAMNFNGDDPLLLYKDDEIIDVFGATEGESPENNVICEGYNENGNYKTRNDESWVANDVSNMDYGKTAEDFPNGEIPDDVNVDDPTITAYTARVIMFRKNSVTSGANAVTKNTDDFHTFAEEWEVRQVCRISGDGDLTCAAYQELGVFDYSAYYVSYDSLTRVDLGGNKNADGTYTIPVPELDTLSCTKMRIQVLDNNGASLASSEYKVPIMVKSSGVTTTDELFSKHGIEGCRDCDVVILKNATLQKAPNGATNDMPEVRDMEVYAGGKLVVPNGTNYTMRKLVMRSKGDEVPVAEIDGTAVISDKLYHAKRIDAQKFYFFTLPYDCAVSDITYYNGEVLGARGIDYVIKYYDGVGRANGQNAGHWEEFTGATLKAGVGYILAVDASLNGDFDDNPKKEFLFPMTKTLTETSNKTVAVGTWGIGDATIGDNHKGWNLIGTPFMSHYNPISATGLKVGTYTDGEWNSEGTIFTYNESVTVPYVTMPNADGKTYTQRLASSQDLEPFKSFFIQVGKEGDVITDVAFSSAERLSKAPRRAPAVDATVWVELELKNASGTDVTTIILDENCTSDYEIGFDLEKMLGYAALPQFYSLQSNARLAFNALPSEFASVSIPLGFYAPKSDTYTIALNTENTQNLEGVYLTDNVTGTITNLLLDDYTFSSAKVLNETRFSIAVVRAVTAVDNVLAEKNFVSMINKSDLHIKNAPIGSELRVYDTLGREVISDQIDAEQKVYHLHTAGVYHVQIVLKDKKSVYKVVSY